MSNEIRPPIDIGGGSKPGSLDPDENRAKLMEQRYGNKPRGGGSGGGTNWMPAIVAIVVSVVIAAAMVFMFNPTKAGLNTLSGQVIELNNRMLTVEEQEVQTIGRLDTFLSNSANYVTQGALTGLTDGMATDSEMSGIENLIVSLTTEVEDLSARIIILETPTENGSDGSVANDEVRWNFSVPSLLHPPVGNNITTKIDTDDRIQEEGLYNLELRIENTGATNIALNSGIRLVLVPRDDALLDEDETYVDSDDPPWLSWDTDFTTKTREGRDLTKRVTFESDKYDFGTIPAYSYRDLPLVLELYYAD